jgi:hypothetical protein
MIKVYDHVQLRMDCTAMEFHSYQGSLDPLWNSTARMGAPEEPGSVALPAVPSCDIKLVFFISYAAPAWPQSGMGGVKAQPWGRTQLWKTTATKAP